MAYRSDNVDLQEWFYDEMISELQGEVDDEVGKMLSKYNVQHEVESTGRSGGDFDYFYDCYIFIKGDDWGVEGEDCRFETRVKLLENIEVFCDIGFTGFVQYEYRRALRWLKDRFKLKLTAYDRFMLELEVRLHRDFAVNYCYFELTRSFYGREVFRITLIGNSGTETVIDTYTGWYALKHEDYLEKVYEETFKNVYDCIKKELN